MLQIILRELRIMTHIVTYPICMILLPILVTVFFTTLLSNGQPQEMPVGVVDLDNTSTTRALIQRLDGMQTSHVVAHYPSVADARQAMQRDSIYAFLYFPEGTTRNLLASRQPHISFYYSNTSLTGGALLFKDLKTVTTLGSAAVGQATMRAKGFTDAQTMAFLSPIKVDAHNINNPWINYNYYLSTMLIPGCLMLFIMLLTSYSLGLELKRKSGRELLAMANGNIFVAIFFKLLPQTVIFFLTLLAHLVYLFYGLGFPHPGGFLVIMLLALASTLAGQGFGVLIFGLIPSVRMSMSICSLWGVLSFSMVGSAFPAFAMDPPLQALSWLFPLRHYFLIYSHNVFNDASLSITAVHWAALIIFAVMPVAVYPRIKKAFNDYVYVE